MDERSVSRIRPELIAAKAHIVRRLVLRLYRMRAGVGERIVRRLADDHAGLSADVARHPNVTRYVVVPDANAIAGLKALARGCIGAARRTRRRQRKESVRSALQFLAGQNAFLDQESRQAGERTFVIAGCEVMARLHALDRVAVLVHVENAEPNCKRIE